MTATIKPLGNSALINNVSNSTFANATCVYVVNPNTTTTFSLFLGPNTSNPTTNFQLTPMHSVRVKKQPNEVLSSVAAAPIVGTKVDFGN